MSSMHARSAIRQLGYRSIVPGMLDRSATAVQLYGEAALMLRLWQVLLRGGDQPAGTAQASQ